MRFKGVGIGLFCCFEDRMGEPCVRWGCRLVWSRLVASGAIDPGSNPGSPTSILVRGCALAGVWFEIGEV